MKISIALAVYNGTNFLDQQLASFLKQTRLPDELVVVDDCSTDATVELLEDFAKTSPFPVKIFRNESNSGSTYSFERAINECSGDLIFLSDHDDIWTERKVEIMSEFTEAEAAGLVFCDAILIDENGNLVGRKLFQEDVKKKIQGAIEEGRLFQLLLQRNYIGGATSCFRRQLIPWVAPFPINTHLYHDGWIGLVASATGKVLFLDMPLNYYRQHSSQQAGAPGRKLSAPRIERQKIVRDALLNLQKRKQGLVSLVSRLESIHSDSSLNLSRPLRYVEDEISKTLRDKFEHFSRRDFRSRRLLQRLPVVIKECISGRYVKYSNGLRSVFRDLTEV
jgi:glycosyltransferase involved in cell wall biosynthesis